MVSLPSKTTQNRTELSQVTTTTTTTTTITTTTTTTTTAGDYKQYGSVNSCWIADTTCFETASCSVGS